MKLRLAIIHFGFALTGVVTTMLGPLLPLFSYTWSLSDAQAGRLFTIQFVFSVTGSLIASYVLSRWGAAVTVCLGMLLIASGGGALAIGSFLPGLAGIAVFGLGLGFALPSTNLWVSELVPEQRASALNFLNFSWTLGAVGTPIIVAWLLKPVGLRGLMLLLAALCAIAAVSEAAGIHSHKAQVLERQPGRLPTGKQIPFALFTAILLFLYVGIETGFAGWVPSFAMRTHHPTPASAAWVQSGFWAAILLGRLMAPWVFAQTQLGTVVLGGLIVSMAGIALSIASSNFLTFIIGVVLCGFGLSAVFPTVVAIFATEYGTGGGGSIVLGVCGFGGALIPWAVGIVSSKSGNLRLGLTVTFISTLAAVAIFWKMRSLMKTGTALPQRQASKSSA